MKFAWRRPLSLARSPPLSGSMAARERRERKHVERLGNYADNEAVSAAACRLPPACHPELLLVAAHPSAECVSDLLPRAAGGAGSGVRG